MRQSAIVLVVPEAEPLVGAIRNAHDPVARRGVPAHVTLLYPWHTPPLGSDAVTLLRATLRKVTPYTLAFREVGQFERTLYLRPDDDGRTEDLIGRIASAFPDHPPYGGRFARPVPHLTVAEVSGSLPPIVDSFVPGLMAGLPLAARVDRVTILVSDADSQWAVHSELPLGSSD